MKRLLLHGHWGFSVPVAAVVTVLAVAAAGWVITQDLRRAEARDGGVPPLVALAEFDPAQDTYYAEDEVHVLARIDMNLIRRFEGMDGEHRRVRHLIPLFGQEDISSPSAVRGAIMLTEPTLQREMKSLFATLGQKTAEGWLDLPLSGRVRPEPNLVPAAMAELRSLGLEPTPGFVFIRPWYVTREERLAPGISWPLILTPLGFALAFILIAVLRCLGFPKTAKRGARYDLRHGYSVRPYT